MNTQKLLEHVEGMEAELAKLGKQSGETADIDIIVQRAHQASRRWLGRLGPLTPEQWRARHPWQAEKQKPDPRSGELKLLAAEVEQLDSEYQEAVRLWEKCVAEQINRDSPLVTTATFQIVPRTDAREVAELDRKIATAAALRDAAAEALQAKRARYYSLLRAEQGQQRAAAQRAEQAAQLEARTRAAEAKKQSFAKDALEFFGIRA